MAKKEETHSGGEELLLLAKENTKSGSSSFPEELPLLAKEEYTSSRSYSSPGGTFTTSLGHPEEWHNGQNLPHRNSPNLIQSITFRLADSLSQEVLREIEDELFRLPHTKREVEKRKQHEKWLDRGLGSCALAHPKMAQVLWESFQYYNGDKYNLIAWSIMPNHVHILIETAHELSKIVQGWKSYTGKWAMANNERYGLGIEKDAKHFWRSEYWDRFIRDEAHFDNVVKYILENPEKAGLEKSSVAYEYTGYAGDEELLAK